MQNVMNRTSTTLDDAVKVPVALQLPSRRTMFDVLMHLHTGSSNSDSNSNTYIGNVVSMSAGSDNVVSSSGVIDNNNIDSDSPMMQ